MENVSRGIFGCLCLSVNRHSAGQGSAEGRQRRSAPRDAAVRRTELHIGLLDVGSRCKDRHIDVHLQLACESRRRRGRAEHGERTVSGAAARPAARRIAVTPCTRRSNARPLLCRCSLVRSPIADLHFFLRCPGNKICRGSRIRCQTTECRSDAAAAAMSSDEQQRRQQRTTDAQWSRE